MNSLTFDSLTLESLTFYSSAFLSEVLHRIQFFNKLIVFANIDVGLSSWLGMRNAPGYPSLSRKTNRTLRSNIAFGCRRVATSFTGSKLRKQCISVSKVSRWYAACYNVILQCNTSDEFGSLHNRMLSPQQMELASVKSVSVVLSSSQCGVCIPNVVICVLNLL